MKTIKFLFLTIGVLFLLSCKKKQINKKNYIKNTLSVSSIKYKNTKKKEESKKKQLYNM